RWQPDRAINGGPIIHEGIHSLDIVQRIIGRQPQRVSAIGSLQFYRPKPKAAEQCSTCQIADTCLQFFDITADPLRRLYDTPTRQQGFSRDLCPFTSNKNTPDSVVGYVEYEGGTMLSYTLNFFAPISTREIRLIGEKGIIVSDEHSGSLTLYKSGENPVSHLIDIPKS